jgi:hypothetical protein
MKKYFYSLLKKYISFYVQPDNTILEVYPKTTELIEKFENGKTVTEAEGIASLDSDPAQYFLLNGCLHYSHDIETLLNSVYSKCKPETRLIITFYSSLWKPLMKLASSLRLRKKTPEKNWLTLHDVENFLRLTNFEVVHHESKILLPVYIPLVSSFFNRILAPLPFFRWFNMTNILVARPLQKKTLKGVSVVVPARNEEGNIENIINRIPIMSDDDEIIFVEGNSTDNTWRKILEVKEKYGQTKNIVIAQQEGKGKGDAVRKGFSLATKDILMILDADISVPPEDLLRFYKAIAAGKGEFINGSRLIYPMEEKAMRFFNILGNKFFAEAFSFVLGQKLKDTLCGTKVLSHENYILIQKYRSYFGDIDPFGDFDLIFGASRLGLKIVEMPIAYKQRVYGSTNIQRWKHGVILLKMLFHASRKIKFT